MLEELAKHDEKWRQIALRITRGDKFHADDLVSEMYLRIHRNYRGQPLGEPYVSMTLLSIYNNEKVKKKHIPVSDIRKTSTEHEDIEDDDFKIIERFNKELTFEEKKILNLSFDYSLREIAKMHKKSYGYANKVLWRAREKVLKERITEHKLIIRKNMKSKGFGDTIEKILKATGVKTLVDKMNIDCGCDERKEYLNRLFAYKLKPRCFTEEELKDYADFVRKRKFSIINESKASGAMTNQEITYLVSMYNSIFSVHYDYPSCLNCGGTAKLLIKMVNDLDKVYLNNIPEQKKVTRNKKEEVE